ncbi:hypothetical protein TNCV_4858361 [Trichonephila clavipes]|nr:hypothetical protein TNCV_4858361 [Trichonephila clavipes]
MWRWEFLSNITLRSYTEGNSDGPRNAKLWLSGEGYTRTGILLSKLSHYANVRTLNLDRLNGYTRAFGDGPRNLNDIRSRALNSIAITPSQVRNRYQWRNGEYLNPPAKVLGPKPYLTKRYVLGVSQAFGP